MLAAHWARGDFSLNNIKEGLTRNGKWEGFVGYDNHNIRLFLVCTHRRDNTTQFKGWRHVVIRNNIFPRISTRPACYTSLPMSVRKVRDSPSSNWPIKTRRDWLVRYTSQANRPIRCRCGENWKKKKSRTGSRGKYRLWIHRFCKND